ncbi:MAG: DUF2865 domain-containing protein [Xanthobacteraceae bacterium]|nr:DUF2865 domain-containing protein [Xanthobacteraceae bacterium]
MFESLTVSAVGRMLAGALLATVMLGPGALAQGYPQPGAANPMCARLEAQLASIDRGGGDPARAEQIRRYQDAANRQQHELDRVTAQAKRMGCDSSGFFSLFNGQSAQCGPVNNQIQQMRANLDQMLSSLERLRGGGGRERDGQRHSLLAALAQNNCGPQYANAARGPGNFLENLFGGGIHQSEAPDPNLAPPPGAPSGTYRTVCVRSCDGYYFPISFATVQSRFADDERTCKNQCPATEANLFTYRNPGEDINQAVSISGQPYTSLPNAFSYRKAFDPNCTCKANGETWSQALKHLDDKASLQRGDIVVTEDSAKKMSQPKAAPPKKGAAAAPQGATAAATPAPAPAAKTDAGKTGIRTVGPTFLPAR